MLFDTMPSTNKQIDRPISQSASHSLPYGSSSAALRAGGALLPRCALESDGSQIESNRSQIELDRAR